ncbi:L-threonine O-3-phosphate decarboxylase [Enterococcus malodoratus]|uniref:threonine-phosphate decarboxylase CobD n=1 Tax=Enterococcus malodoratus TaxID=71451 RepID=UPI0008B7D461|nr:threonine-phosphate decarboxylase CobD [Enterococcus malodoratus]SET49752.1 L-threonine O-3-phosphate decarboxylase [Enterococcus malodoratus]
MVVKHGGNIQEISETYQKDKNSLIDFSANINPLGIPKGVKKVLSKGIEELIHYPDIRYRALTQAIASFHEVSEDFVYPANGAAEAIFMLGKTLKLDRLLLLAPTFMEYEAAFGQQKTEFCYFNLEQHDFRLSLSALHQSAKQQKVNGICLCNPNNPTGQLIKQSELDELLIFCQENELVLIIDEAFVDFTKEEHSLVSKIKDYPNLFIFRSLTKMFAIPGLRLGYLLTSNLSVLAEIEEKTVPWHINTFADLAGQQALQEEQFIKDSQQYITQERQFLVNGLSDFKELEVFPSQTNFLFFRYHGADCLQAEMIKKNILIRNCNSFNGLNHKYYRIAVKSRTENQILLDALEAILCE